MKAAALLLFCAACIGQAHAFNAEPIVARLDDVSFECSSGLNHDGETITKERQLQSCRESADLRAALAENNMCKVDYEWKPCK